MTREKIEPRIDGTELVIDTISKSEAYDSRFVVAAALVYVAKGDGHISEAETQKMLQLVGDHFGLGNAASLALLTSAIGEMADNVELPLIVRHVSDRLSDGDKEDIACMMLKVIAADGRQHAEELEALRDAATIMDISAESMHNAFDRYFDDKPV